MAAGPQAHRQSCASEGNRVGCWAPGSWSTRARKEAREYVDLAIWCGWVDALLRCRRRQAQVVSWGGGGESARQL
eukprot:1012393-Prorocentrum_minimum.AAC.1